MGDNAVASKDDIASQMKVIRLYRRRWFILSLSVLYMIVNGFQWIQFIIVSDKVVKFYGTTTMWVTWTTTIFLIQYFIFIFPASYMLHRLGLRVIVIIGMTLTTLGTWIKLGAVDPNRFWVAFLGQSVIGMANPLVMPLPPVVSSTWFDTSQISLACSIGVAAYQIGMALGYIATPMIVKSESVDDMSKEFYILYGSSAIISTSVLLILLFFFQNAPAHPPSFANAIQDSIRSNNYLASLKNILTNRSFVFVLISYGILNGIANSLGILMNSIVLNSYPTSNAASKIGTLAIITSVFGVILHGYILDKWKKFKVTSLINYALMVFGMVALTLWISEGIGICYIIILTIGFLASGSITLGYQLAAELIYPEKESTSTALMVCANYIFFIVFTNIYTILSTNVNGTWAKLFFVISLVVGMLFLLLTESDMRRQKAQKYKGRQ